MEVTDALADYSQSHISSWSEEQHSRFDEVLLFRRPRYLAKYSQSHISSWSEGAALAFRPGSGMGLSRRTVSGED